MRNELCIKSQGEGTDSIFNGAYMPADSDHIDNHTTMDHAFPNCTSSEMPRNYVRQVNRSTTGKYTLDSTLKRQQLSAEFKYCCIKGATINTKPELEIYADDVKVPTVVQLVSLMKRDVLRMLEALMMRVQSLCLFKHNIGDGIVLRLRR